MIHRIYDCHWSPRPGQRRVVTRQRQEHNEHPLTFSLSANTTRFTLRSTHWVESRYLWVGTGSEDGRVESNLVYRTFGRESNEDGRGLGQGWPKTPVFCPVKDTTRVGGLVSTSLTANIEDSCVLIEPSSDLNRSRDVVTKYKSRITKGGYFVRNVSPS